MNPISENRSIGLNFDSRGAASLTVWAPTAENMEVKVNNTSAYTMYPAEMGLWEIRNLNIKEGDNYQIIIDGKILPDPASVLQDENVHGPSRAFDLCAFRWDDRGWRTPRLNELIIYELHTGTFTNEGTFDAIIGKLPYLKDLGVNAVELMPVAQFPGSRNWGYDGVYPFAVQKSYGGPERLQHLVNTCHQQGMAVILDVVYNHLGPEGNYLPAFGPVFTDKYKTPWGQAINFDDAWSDGVRLFFIENVLMWFRNFHIDGLRLDAVHAIKDFGSLHILREIKEHVNVLNKELERNHFLIAESDLNDIKFISLFEEGGYGLDATWCDEFHHSLHSLATGEKNGYYSDFGEIHHLVKSVNNAFVYDGIWSDHRKRRFGNKTRGVPGHKFVVFTQNHDQVGNRMMGERLSSLIDFELLKAVAGTMLLSPFTPMLFMGEEYAETQPFLYFTSHSDPELIRLVREGRKEEFKAFMNQGQAPDPDDEKAFIVSKLNWDRRSKNQEIMFSFYKELISLRKSLPALKNPDRQNITAKAIENENAFYLISKHPSQTLLAIINYGDNNVLLDAEETREINWKLILDSSDEKWGGSKTSPLRHDPVTSARRHAITLLINS
jgi:maltooligosyltrehalose trehalohydrolase